jgi:hypothetical protein
MAELNNGLDSFKIYVGTYKKFNEGSLFGKWLSLSDYCNYNELLKAMIELHKDEKDPKFMFINWECHDLFQKFNLVNKYYLSEDIYDIITTINDAGLDVEILEAFSLCFVENDIWEAIRKADDCYCGKFDSDIEFVKYLLWVLGDIARNLIINYAVSNGHYFRKD